MQRIHHPSRSWRSGAGNRSTAFLVTLSLGLAGMVGCAVPISGDNVDSGTLEGTGGNQAEPGTGGAQTGVGGTTTGVGGRTGAGGSGVGGQIGTGGATTGTGGRVGTGGSGVGGGLGTGGRVGTGGAVTGTGGATTGTGGRAGTGGAVTGTGGAVTGTGGTTGACVAGATWTGGKTYSANSSGNVGNGYTYQRWSNGTGSGSMTVAGVDAKFSATWSNVGDFLARVGLGWNSTQTFDQLGTIAADYTYTKTGSGGGFSYIGIYGWSENPLHEFYIVDDWYGTNPPTGGGSKVGSFTVDGAMYNVYTHTQNNQPAITGGNQTFVQYFSVRQTARQCGHISISEHFKEWANLGLTLGKMEEARILVEVGGGNGTINFTTATVTAN
jgi:endo-1,4-beta-xylanase